ncbi:NAD(P)/FAD-dependent oxidoreductase [Geodermatophilus sabuli]|uniref:3-phenylpropionate/trans-cinnamate dioxygenase ferredoxin reductase subunit n=1 Tax=Geodermatophilus sabuli TaxID=1564158 RepID=A0A285E9N5_9ACTN|nr:FAD-dependent oxidoreductase [Geodermatophilus sabuli]MBB3082359.1 3-phenylpropionate/trans-cinnamate dioxygenase ferredoxin reductase subunit [Geodermatophilus sabuli]SNX94771.1 3-phenylpropionate/trans-cinnamate dioxygenase ferredoxin reductase subunit [Geodermatophilus sabuli]
MSTAPANADARVVVIGAGHASATLAGLLRQAGHRGEIVVIGDERDHPYHRPPLSKKFADGDLEQWIRPADFYREQDVTMRLGERATSVDPIARRVRVDSGEEMAYDALVLATGARPRPLPVPGADLDGVGALRTLGDARELRTWLDEGRRLVIVGGGYIGLEVAAVARSRGVGATVLEREERLLARVASRELSAIMAERHAAAGTTIRTGAQVVGLEGSSGRVRQVTLADGSALDCDAVLVGVGAIPNDGLAAEAGVDCDGGVLVDEGARTSVDGVLAIGDVTVRPVPGLDGRRRLESIPSATEQARQAVATIHGAEDPTPEVPWFWSDQFDLKLKIAGIVRPDHDVVLRGDPVTGKFALFHLADGVPVAVESANASPEFMAGKKWIGACVRVDPTRLADPNRSPRDAVVS